VWPFNLESLHFETFPELPEFRGCFGPRSRQGLPFSSQGRSKPQPKEMRKLSIVFVDDGRPTKAFS